MRPEPRSAELYEKSFHLYEGMAWRMAYMVVLGLLSFGMNLVCLSGVRKFMLGCRPALVLSVVAPFLFLSACQNTTDLGTSPTLGGQEAAEFQASPGQYQKAIASVYLTLGRKPISPSWQSSIVDQQSYEEAVLLLLDSKDFSETMIQYHLDLFDLSDMEGSEAYKSPGYLGAFVVTQGGRPYSEVLTGNYCVDLIGGELQEVPCSSMPFVDSGYTAPPSSEISGVLTIPSLLAQWAGAQNLRRVENIMQRFVCVSYPDSVTGGWGVEQIDFRYGGTGQCHPQVEGSCEPQQTDEGALCHHCHTGLNAKAAALQHFDALGSYDPMQTMQTIEAAEGFDNPLSVMVLPGRYKDAELYNIRDLALQMADDDRFVSCQTRRFYNFLFNKNPLDPVPAANLEYFREGFEESNQDVRDLLFRIVTHEIYLNR